jgi:hypothetical protein
MVVSIIASSLVALAMALVAGLGWRHWRRLDAGARPIVIGVALSVVGVLVSLAFIAAHRTTRPVQEVLVLAETGLVLWGMAAWQTGAGARTVLRVLIPIWVVAWIGAQVVQGADQPFSPISAPIGHTLKVGSAAYTLIVRFRATDAAWTGQLWFWFCTGIMLIYGTGIFLDPLLQGVFRARPDLLFAGFLFNLVLNVIGYLVMARGLLLLRDPVAVPDSRPGLT